MGLALNRMGQAVYQRCMLDIVAGWNGDMRIFDQLTQAWKAATPQTGVYTERGL